MIIGIAISGYSQSTRIYFGLGSMYHRFQDARFSDLKISGSELFPELGFRNIAGEHFIYAYTNVFIYSTEQPNTVYPITSLGFNVRAGYLRRVLPGFYLGGTLDIFDYVTRDTEGLSNSSNFYHTASDLFFSAKYLYSLGSDWQFEFGSDLGILSLVKTAPSFTTNFQQNVVDNGNVSFQDPEVRQPWNFRYYDVKPIWEQFYLRTHIETYFRKRFSAAYLWRMRAFSDQKGYPVTLAVHSLSLRYHFISKENN